MRGSVALLMKILAVLADLWRRIRRVEQVAGYDYFANGVDDTEGVRAMIAEAIASGIPAAMRVHGTCALWIAPGLELDVTGLARNSSLTFLDPIVRHWDPLNADPTLGGWITGTGTATAPLAPNFTLAWEVIDYSPKLTSDCTVVAVNTDPTTGYFDVQPKPGFEPAFDTMRVFHKIEDDIWTFSQSEERGSAPGISYPVVPIGGGLYRVSPTSDTIAITSIAALLPLTVTAADGLDSERRFVASGFTGADAASINGHVYTFDLDQGTRTRAVLMENGTEVDLTGKVITGMGVLTSPRIPVEVTVGAEMVLVCRKRGIPEIAPRYPKGWVIKGGPVRGATAVFLAPSFSEDLTIENLVFRGEGRMSATAGGIILVEHRGLLRIDNYEGSGLGDDGSNQTPRYWNKTLTAYTSTTLTIDTTKVWLPRLTDKALFISPAKVRTFVPITGVDPSVPTATVVTVAVPVGFDPATWIVRNANVYPRIRAGSMTSEGGSRSFFYQTPDGSAAITHARNTRGPVNRQQDPKSGAHSDAGAYGGGLRLGAYELFRVCMSYVATFTCAVFVHRIQGATAPTGLPADHYGPVVCDGYGFMFGIHEGVDCHYESVTIADGGLLRASTPQTAGDPTLCGNFDFVAIAATIWIHWLNLEALLWVKIKTLYDGNVVILNRGGLGELPAINADQSIRTLAYRRLRNTLTLTAPRTYTLEQLGAQNGDSFEIVNDGSGTMTIADETTGLTLGTVNGGERAIASNNGTRWS